MSDLLAGEQEDVDRFFEERIVRKDEGGFK